MLKNHLRDVHGKINRKSRKRSRNSSSINSCEEKLKVKRLQLKPIAPSTSSDPLYGSISTDSDTCGSSVEENEPTDISGVQTDPETCDEEEFLRNKPSDAAAVLSCYICNQTIPPKKRHGQFTNGKGLPIFS